MAFSGFPFWRGALFGKDLGSPRLKRLPRLRLALEQLEDRTVLSTFDVGPGLAYTTIGAVPWENLKPGDVVNIHWQSNPYHEKVLFSASGTAAQPIQVVGIASSSGQLPVLDGANATTRSTAIYPYAGTQDRGLFTVTLNTNQSWGYIPSYIQIKNLQFQNAYVGNTFTDYQGVTRTYANDSAGIYVERGQHILVQNCTITGNGDGFFVASSNAPQQLSQDITVQGSYIYGNGVVGTDQEHNIYTECIGIVFQYNHLGAPRAGSLGNNLKDRSAGTVIRYNYIETGGHLLDLVDPQNSAPITTLAPNFHQTFVYGNVFVNGNQGATYLIHYGGDDEVYQNYRKGTLYFYNNTIINQADQSSRWRTMMLQLDTNEESADVRNNILYNVSFTPGATPTNFELLSQYGVADFYKNWVSPGWLPSNDGETFYGTITGTNNFFVDPNNNPGFANFAGGDFHLAAGSNAIDQGIALAAGALGTYDVGTQYVDPQYGQGRPALGAAPDLGAFENGVNTGTYQAVALGVSASSTTTIVGKTLNVTVNAVDVFGSPVLGYTGKVHFTSSDAAAVLPTDYVFQASDKGAHTFTVTLKTAGNQTVTVQDANNSLLKGSSSITVSLAAARFSVVPSGSLSAGTPFAFTVTALDVNGNLAAGYTGTVHFTSSDPKATLPANYTFTSADAGVHTFANIAILRTSGNQTLTAVDTANSGINGSFTAKVGPAAGVKLVFGSLPNGSVAGTSFTVTLTALDQFGNTATGYLGTVRFSSSDVQSGVPSNYTFTTADNGAHTFTKAITLKTAGAQSVSATDTANASINSSFIVAVSPAGAAKYNRSAPSSWSAGSVFSVTVTVLDLYGNTVTNYGGRVHFSSTDAHAILPTDYTFTPSDSGVHTFVNLLTLKTSGNQTVTVVDTQTSSITANFSVLVKPSAATHFVITPPSKVVLGLPFSVTVTAIDPFGNKATGYLGSIGIGSTDKAALLRLYYTFTTSDAGVHVFSGIILQTLGLQYLGVADLGSKWINGAVGITVTQTGSNAVVFGGAQPQPAQQRRYQVTVARPDGPGGLPQQGTVVVAAPVQRAQLGEAFGTPSTHFNIDPDERWSLLGTIFSGRISKSGRVVRSRPN